MNTRFEEITSAKEQVRLRADIASVVGRYVNLKARGQTMLGLCPFHKEKTPSFTVNPARGFYHCFGCGKGGDLFSFVQEIEGVDFIEALEMLADETGVKIEMGRRDGGYDSRYDGGGAPPSPQQSKAAKTDLLAIHDEAANYYYQCMKNCPQAIDYFKSRGLTGETVREFRLGYAPAGWSGLCDHLRGKGVPLPSIAESGLVISKDNGGVYDRFRDRIMFPLADLNNRVVAFAGRGLGADAQPKYLNSPETALYRKSRILYGLQKARQDVRDKGSLLIVEGYMDYLTLYQAGIRNVAAVSGTAFTEDHAGLIRRSGSNRAVLVFDGDRAGRAAAQRAAFVLAPFDLQISILTLPDGDDPDTFVKREGAAAFAGLLPSAKPAADFLIDKFVSEHDGSPISKSWAVGELAPYMAALSDPIVLDDFVSKLAQRLRVDRRHIADRLSKFKAGGPRTENRPDDETAVYETGGGLGPLEESFLRIILTDPELIVSARQYISPKMLTDSLSANIYSIILDVYARGGGLGGLPDAVGGDSEAGRMVSMLAAKPARTENIHDEFAQKVLILRRKYLKARMSALTVSLRHCPEESEKERILGEIRDCGEQLKELDLRE